MATFPTALPEGSRIVEVTRALCAPLPWFSTSVRIKTVLHPAAPRRDEGSPLLHVNRVRLHQPDVPINSRALVEPAIARGGIHAHQQDILAAGSCESVTSNLNGSYPPLCRLM